MKKKPSLDESLKNNSIEARKKRKKGKEKMKMDNKKTKKKEGKNGERDSLRESMVGMKYT